MGSSNQGIGADSNLYICWRLNESAIVPCGEVYVFALVCRPTKYLSIRLNSPDIIHLSFHANGIDIIQKRSACADLFIEEIVISYVRVVRLYLAHRSRICGCLLQRIL